MKGKGDWGRTFKPLLRLKVEQSSPSIIWYHVILIPTSIRRDWISTSIQGTFFLCNAFTCRWHLAHHFSPNPRALTNVAGAGLLLRNVSHATLQLSLEQKSCDKPVSSPTCSQVPCQCCRLLLHLYYRHSTQLQVPHPSNSHSTNSVDRKPPHLLTTHHSLS